MWHNYVTFSCKEGRACVITGLASHVCHIWHVTKTVINSLQILLHLNTSEYCIFCCSLVKYAAPLWSRGEGGRVVDWWWYSLTCVRTFGNIQAFKGVAWLDRISLLRLLKNSLFKGRFSIESVYIRVWFQTNLYIRGMSSPKTVYSRIIKGVSECAICTAHPTRN